MNLPPKLQNFFDPKQTVVWPSILILYFIHKFFGRFTQFKPQSIAQHFSLLPAAIIGNKQFNYNVMSLFLYVWSSNALGPGATANFSMEGYSSLSLQLKFRSRYWVQGGH